MRAFIRADHSWVRPARGQTQGVPCFSTCALQLLRKDPLAIESKGVSGTAKGGVRERTVGNVQYAGDDSNNMHQKQSNNIVSAQSRRRRPRQVQFMAFGLPSRVGRDGARAARHARSILILILYQHMPLYSIVCTHRFPMVVEWKKPTLELRWPLPRGYSPAHY